MSKIDYKLPISALVVGYNESRFLKQCFESISFCDEILYTDLGSTDDSVAVAGKFAKKIFHRRRENIPSCEMAQTEVVHYTLHDWVLFIDPDEKVDPQLAAEIMTAFPQYCASETLGAVSVPWQFYFRERRLQGTTWGGVNRKFLLVNKQRFQFLPVIHYGRKLADGFRQFDIMLNESGSNVLHHYWMNSYTVFLRKHMRYLKNEGRNRYNQGTRINWKVLLATPYRQFRWSYFTRKGYRDGLPGLALSLFWSFYESSACGSVFLLQKKFDRRYA